MKEKNRAKYTGLTSTKVLAKNSLITIMAKILPLLVGVLALPYLISELGEANFGMLAIIWLVIGYFSMFDLGIGRAVVKQISDLIGDQKIYEIPKAAWTGILSIGAMGIIAGFVLFFAGELILAHFFEVQNNSIKDALFYTSYAVPFIVATTGFRAVLMAEQNFLAISVIQSLNSLFNYLLPLILLYFWQLSFLQIVIALLVLKVLAFFAFAFSAIVSEPQLRTGVHFSVSYFSNMFHFGKWVTISNIIGPLMSQLDRYFIAAFISVSAVTFYTTPLEVLTKLMMIPMAFITVLFPAFSTLANQSYERREQLFLEATKGVMIILFLPVLLLSTFAEFGLWVWVGEEFVSKSTFVAQIFCAIFFIRGIAYIPASYLPGMNRPELPALFHTIEIIIFAAALYVVGKATGNINYIALVSLAMTMMDTFLLMLFTYKLFTQKKELLSQLIIPMGTGSVILLTIAFISSNNIKYLIFGLVSLVFILIYKAYLIETVKKLTSKLRH